jgi:hypothetical protein
MANDSTDHLQVQVETDRLTSMSKFVSYRTDLSSTVDNKHSWKNLSNNSINSNSVLRISSSHIRLDEAMSNRYKNLPGAMPINMNQMINARNSNAPWLVNVLKKKFRRCRTSTPADRSYSNENDSSRMATNRSIMLSDDILEKPISLAGTSGKWIVHENDVVLPMMKVRE